VVAEVREGRSFKDSDIERAVRVALLDQPIRQASVSSADQSGGGGGRTRPTVSQGTLAAHPLAIFLKRIAGLIRFRGFQGHSSSSRCGRSCGTLRRHLELAERHALEGEENIGRQREIVARREDLWEPLTLRKAQDLLRIMEHTQLLRVTERDRLREQLGN
jgi:hypothetical protein